MSNHLVASRGLFWNDFGSFSGAYFGSSFVIVAHTAMNGQWLSAVCILLYGFISLAVQSRWYGVPHERHWALGIGCISAGIFLALTIVIAAIELPTGDSHLPVHYTALFYFLAFMFMGIVLIVQRRHFKPADQQ